MIPFNADSKDQIKKMLAIYEPYADPGFVNSLKTKGEFLSRCWEMYVTCSLIDQGYNIQPKRQSEGPDCTILTDKVPIHIESVMLTPGAGPDALPPLREGMQDVSVGQLLLRFSNGMSDKMSDYGNYLGVHVDKNHPFVVAISKGSINQPDVMPSMALRYLLGVGDFTISFPVDGGNSKTGNREQNILKKLSGKEVGVGFFRKKENAGISAVIYCDNHILNHPVSWGSDFVLIKNPFATNPLPLNFLNRGAEWEHKGEFLELREKSFKRSKFF